MPAGDPRVPAPDRDLTGLATMEVLRALETGPRGLPEAQAEERLVRYGENILPGARSVPWWRRFLRSLRDPFTSVLFCLALVSAAVAAWHTSCVIMVLVIVSCTLRSGGEYRADRSAAALRELVAATATVRRRTGAQGAAFSREIPVDQLVPGDVVALGPGDLVPADVRLIRANGLTLHQAVLTGESTPAAKYVVDVPDGSTPLAGQPHMCFQGSSVASGSAVAVVVATGGNTRFAGTSRRLTAQRRQTAFDRSVQGISRSLIRFMLLTPPLVLMADAGLRGRGLETLPFAVAVAVGLTPEMLPVVVTMVLARGASRLARDRDVIVRRLPALHDLAAMDVLCTDKTGTLTEDRPVLDSCLDADGRPDPDVLRWAAANSLWTLQLAELPVPDELDEVLLAAAHDHADHHSLDGVAAIPFDPVRRLATAVVRQPHRPGRHTLVVKGAAEAVLERCTRVRVAGADVMLDDDARARFLDACARQADSGLRVLAVALAERTARPGPRTYTLADERELTFLGTVALRDAAADSAAEALAALARHGVHVKVLTGDHPGTAARACLDIGLDPSAVVTGDRIDAMTGAELARLAERTTVFARCTPEHKARVVQALRDGGHVTGFLGDGVNDLPALHACDVGICPRDATDTAREGADVVLAAKDLTALDQAITTGRRSSANIATYLRVSVSSNLGNVIAMLAAGLMLPFLPMLPSQVLVQNLCFDAAQLTFAYDRPPSTELQRPATLRPRDFLRFVTRFGILNAAADVGTFGALALAVHGLGNGGRAAFQSGWFTENLLTQALVMLLLRPRRASTRGRAPRPIRLAASALAVIGVLLPLSPLAAPLGLTGLPSLYYALLAIVLTAYGVALVVAHSRHELRADGVRRTAASNA
jgi:Mg2+-importing ATPase